MEPIEPQQGKVPSVDDASDTSHTRLVVETHPNLETIPIISEQNDKKIELIGSKSKTDPVAPELGYNCTLVNTRILVIILCAFFTHKSFDVSLF
jgi:hypothetical protein